MKKDNYWLNTFTVTYKGTIYSVTVFADFDNESEQVKVRILSQADEFFLDEFISFDGDRDRCYEFIQHCSHAYINAWFIRCYHKTITE